MDAEPKIMDFNLGLVLSLLKGGRKVNRNCWQLGSLTVAEDEYIRYALTSETTYEQLRHSANNTIVTLARMLEHEESNKRRHRMMSMLIIDICDGVKKESLRRIKHNADRKSERSEKAAALRRLRAAAPLRQKLRAATLAEASAETQDTAPTEPLKLRRASEWAKESCAAAPQDAFSEEPAHFTYGRKTGVRRLHNPRRPIVIDKTLTIQPSPTADVNGTPASYGPRAPFGITGVVVSFPNGISSDPPETLQIIESQTQVDGACENLIVATASDADGMSFARSTMPLSQISFEVQSNIADSPAVVAIRLVGHE